MLKQIFNQQAPFSVLFDKLEFRKNNEALHPADQEKALRFITNLLLLQSEGKIKIVFRGENMESLKGKFNLPEGQAGQSKLNDLLFLMGDKGRYYRKQYRDSIKEKKKLFRINETGEDIFKHIFDKFNKIFKRKNDKVIETFMKQNESSVSYFLDNRNKLSFCTIIGGLRQSGKQQIRDYYLAALHHTGGIGYKDNSIFVSTSTNISTAAEFASQHSTQGIVFVGWAPLQVPYLASPALNEKMNHQILKKSKLPSFAGKFYPKQSEISIKGGFLPHYMLGYIQLANYQFELNPHLFIQKKNTINITKHGFDIDQSDFDRKRRDTDIEVYFVLDDLGNFMDIF